MRKFLYTFILIIGLLMIFASSFASETIELGANISNKTYKEEYSKGDTFVVELTIDKACDNFGFLMGMLEYDDSNLSVEKLTTEGIPVVEDDEIEGYISPKFFDAGENNSSKSITFWLEDDFNRITEGRFGLVRFKAKNDVDADDLVFEYVKVKASDFNVSTSYSVKTSNKNKKTQIDESEDLADELQEIHDKVNEEQQKQKDAILNNETVSKSTSSSVGKNKTTPKAENSSAKTNQSKEDSTEKPKNSSTETKQSIQDSTTKPKDSIFVAHFWSKASNWALPELQSASQKNLIPDSFRNKDFTLFISRKDFAAVAVKLYESISGKKASVTKSNPFTDTNDDYVMKAYELEITKGISADKFGPDSEITREQMATMLYRTLGIAGLETKIDLDKAEKFVDDNEIHNWGKEAIYFMASKDIIKGISSTENRFGVLNNASIEQAIAISLRCVNNLKY